MSVFVSSPEYIFVEVNIMIYTEYIHEDLSIAPEIMKMTEFSFFLLENSQV